MSSTKKSNLSAYHLKSKSSVNLETSIKTAKPIMFTERRCLDIWNKLTEDADELSMEVLLPLYAISVLKQWGSHDQTSSHSNDVSHQPQ